MKDGFGAGLLGADLEGGGEVLHSLRETALLESHVPLRHLVLLDRVHHAARDYCPPRWDLRIFGERLLF